MFFFTAVAPSFEKARAKGIRTSDLWCSLRYAVQNSNCFSSKCLTSVGTADDRSADGRASVRTCVDGQKSAFTDQLLNETYKRKHVKMMVLIIICKAFNKIEW